MKRRILVVEDDVSLARVLCDNLVYEGFDVALAGDGRRALRDGQVFKPDLVLLDLALPGLDGFEVCRRLTAEQSRTAIIILTARSQKENKVQGLTLGADDYITKPFALEKRTRPRQPTLYPHGIRRRLPADSGPLTVGDSKASDETGCGKTLESRLNPAVQDIARSASEYSRVAATECGPTRQRGVCVQLKVSPARGGRLFRTIFRSNGARKIAVYRVPTLARGATFCRRYAAVFGCASRDILDSVGHRPPLQFQASQS